MRNITRWCKRLILFVWVFFVCSALQANDNQNIVFETLVADNYLPEGAVNSVLQDDVGFLWIGTWKGLYRYDGYHFENFSSINPAFEALKISEMMLNGNDLWIGSFVTGLLRIDLNTYKITVYHTHAEAERQISDNNIISLCAMPDSSILAGTERGGFFIVDSDYTVSHSFTPENSDFLHSRQVTAIAALNDSVVALGNNSFLLFNLHSYKAEIVDDSAINYHIGGIQSISYNEFLVFNQSELVYLNIEEDKPTVKPILQATVKQIQLKDNNNPFLFSVLTGNNVYEYDHQSMQIQQVFDEQAGVEARGELNTLIHTADGATIAGTERGLYAMVKKSNVFRHYSTPHWGDDADIVSNVVKAGEQLFAGTWGKGIFKLNNEKKVLEPVKFEGSDDNSMRFIFAMKAIGSDIWFSTKGQLGIHRFSFLSEPYKLIHYPVVRGIDNANEYFTVTAIHESTRNGILLGTWEGLILQYNKQNDCFDILTDTQGLLPFSEGLSINSIAEDHEGNIWIAVSGGGVLKMKIVASQIVSQDLLTTDNGLSSNFATSIYQSRNQKIWIGTEAGLNIYENGTLSKLQSRDIVFDVQSIIEDPIGYLWFATQRGLVRVNSNNLDDPLKIFDQSDGLKNRTYFLNSVFADTDFTFNFGGYSGIDYFTPYKIDYNFKKPRPRLTRFSVFNEAVYPVDENNHILEKNIFNTDKIKLNHNQNTFSIFFSNLEYQMQEKCQFAYMLEGVDIDWNYQGASTRYAYYTRIAPGTYTFYLRSSNNDGIWSTSPIELTIVIMPPFWASTLAYIVYFVLAMVAIFLVIYTRIIKVQKQHRQKLRELEHQKQEELNELKISFFTNISHEFRTPLTLIMGPLAQILEKEKNDPYKDRHLTIFRNANRLLLLTNRILDFQKNEHAQLKLRVEPVLFSDYVYSIFQYFNYEAQYRNIDYRFKTTHDETVYIDKEFIESILFNILSNAFKYTPDNESIEVIVCAEGDKIMVKIADTGQGIEPRVLEHIFTRFYSTSNKNSTGIGLSLSQRLANLHKGEILLESTMNKGSVFTLQLPLADVYNEHEKHKSEEHRGVIDWQKVDTGMHQKMKNELGNIKKTFDKDQLLALVVDDNYEIRQFIRSLLDEKFNVMEAGNGQKAFELAMEHLPDIVISDVMMPVMDGFELCEKLKTESKTDHIPIILTTVLSEQTHRIKGLSRGADSYIPKPIDPQHLLVRVNKLIEKQLRLKEKFNLDEYTTKSDETETDEPQIHPLIEKARQIVIDNLDNSEYNIDEFCNDLGMSRMQLYRKFKAITGMSANNFIRKVRLHQASQMLKTGNYSIKEVTYDVGFIDLKYFRKCFYEEFGENPSEYMKKHAKS